MGDPLKEVVYIGETNFRNKRLRFGIKRDDRRRHMYLLGKTGMGKSTTLENMIASDINAGHGLVVVDPHGDLAEKALSFVPSSRINDTIYFDPIDIDRPIAFNVLEQVDSRYRNLVASGLVGVFKKIWADSWGPRLEYILTNTILSLLEYQNSTMLAINRMLTDKAFRRKVVENVSDPVVKAFWINEYEKYNERFMSEAIAPIQNKIGQFLSSSIIRNIVGQPKSTVNMRDIMDNNKILILNLAKGKIGEEISALLGAMFITKIQLAAMSRADIVETERRDFYMYVDEFQNFATDSFADILSEARKYRLNLVMAHQYIAQLEHGDNTRVRDAVFGNVGTILTFRIGAADAEFLETEFAPVFEPGDLVNLRKFNFYIKLMIDGVASNPFSGTGLPPVDVQHPEVAEKIKKVSRERYGRELKMVEDKISRWYQSTGEDKRDQKRDQKQGDWRKSGGQQGKSAGGPGAGGGGRSQSRDGRQPRRDRNKPVASAQPKPNVPKASPPSRSIPDSTRSLGFSVGKQVSLVKKRDDKRPVDDKKKADDKGGAGDGKLNPGEEVTFD
jgi:hypothetical protein